METIGCTLNVGSSSFDTVLKLTWLRLSLGTVRIVVILLHEYKANDRPSDYGESSYIGPINGDQPNSQGWVDGYPHLGFLDMTSYYAQGYKTGRYPTISQDKVYIWSRPHPRDANACCDSVGRPNNYQWVCILYMFFGITG